MNGVEHFIQSHVLVSNYYCLPIGKEHLYMYQVMYNPIWLYEYFSSH